MKYKDPVNILSGLKYKLEVAKTEDQAIPTHLVNMKTYKNETNIIKPFTKPISKIF